MDKMTDDELFRELQSDSLLNRARQQFEISIGRIEQAMAQRISPTPIDFRRMEFEEIRKIAAVLGVKL